jgi:hypothetical protein
LERQFWEIAVVIAAIESRQQFEFFHGMGIPSCALDTREPGAATALSKKTTIDSREGPARVDMSSLIGQPHTRRQGVDTVTYCIVN